MATQLIERTTEQTAEERIAQLESMLIAIGRIPVGPDAATGMYHVLQGKFEYPEPEMELCSAKLYVRRLEEKLGHADAALRFYASSDQYVTLDIYTDDGKTARNALHRMAGWCAR